VATLRARAFRFLQTAATAAVLALLTARAWAGATVAIVKGKDVDKMVAEAVDLLGGMKQFVKDGQRVVLKPNLVHQPNLPTRWHTPRDKSIRPAFTTDIRIVRALSQQMLQAAKCKLTLAEGTPNEATRMFEFLGYTQLAKELGINLVDLDQSERMTVKVDGLARKEYSLPAVTQTCDVLVDIAVMKTHHLTGVTLGMKNLFGLTPMPKRQFHAKINEVLCDLCLARKPDLVLVDGLVAMEGQGPLDGTTVQMDLLVAGRDIVAVDAVCTAIMGFDPDRVKHLKLASGKGIGESDLKKITVKGVPIEEVRRPFKHARWEAQVSVRKTDALVGKLVQLADRVYKHDDSEEIYLSFPAERLKVDKEKHPDRESHGFSVHVPLRGDRILFNVPYRVLFGEEGQAAADEVGVWIQQNLGRDIEMAKTPSREPD